MLDAKIKFFDIKRCGYYRRGESTVSLSNVNDTLEKLNAWATDGRDFANTTCYQPDPDNDLLNTYFCGWSQNATTKDSLLVLWNQVPNDNGVIYGMNPSVPPGVTAMLSTDFGSTPAIPGAPSYIWIIPSKNVFATIRFTHSVQGKINLDHYINGFLQNKSPYRVKNSEGKVIGFSRTGQPTQESAKIHPKFEAYTRKQEELEAELITNINKISKIIKRETLIYTAESDRKIFERVFSKLLPNAPAFSQPRTISHELQFSPTESELKSIIKNFGELGQDTFINNAGFVYKNGKTIMLSGTNVAFSHSFSITRGEKELISPHILLNAVTQDRADLLRPLDQPAFVVEEAA
ncbi:hypothetical protein [Rhodocyclus tenuis]|uniref:Uncharacterized protein n=1 Tax=Rhodocyclus tenuis TaxID=1066 RepID=A0A840G7H2_RHOTE|nr:hypothetical protein [Rhodocyclus tenuis]MBB4247361.1 hypothetical protein [Rhodocyclus tenuis]